MTGAEHREAPGARASARALALGLVLSTFAVAVTLAALAAFALATGASIGGGTGLDHALFALSWLWVLGAPVATGLGWVAARTAGHRGAARGAGALFGLWLATTVWLFTLHG